LPNTRSNSTSKRSCVVEAYTDPEVPPLPPHIELEQALAYWKALLTGETNRWHILSQSMKQLFA